MKQTLGILALVLVAAACGAAQKVEAGGEQLDRAIDRDSKKVEREVNGLVEADAGKRASPAPDAAH